MRTSDNTVEITKALIDFHSEIGKIKKDAKNPFFRSDYATLSSILDSIKDPLAHNGLTFTQSPEGENGLTTRLMHESGEWMEATYTMIPAKNDPQGQGSAITYQRRYSLGAVLGLNIDNDDDGNAASMPVTAQKAPSKPLSPYQQLRTKILFEKSPSELEKKKAALMEKRDAVTPDEFKELVNLIDESIKKLNTKSRKKEVKEDSRNSAEMGVEEIESIQVEN